MKIVIALFATMFSFSICTEAQEIQNIQGVETNAEPKLTINFSECFLKVDTVSGEAEVIIYNIKPSRKAKLNRDVYMEVFGFTDFKIQEFGLSPPQSGPTAIRVLAKTKAPMKTTSVEQLLSSMLGTNVMIEVSGGAKSKQMSIRTTLQTRMYIAQNNALRVLKNTDKKEVLMEFDLSPPKPLEIVFGWKEKETFAEKLDKKYQHDADIFRLRHLKHYSDLIEAFHKKTGKYPLQGKSKYQNYVHLAAPHQLKYTKQSPPFKHDVTGLKDFRKALETGLGKKVEFKFDPQKIPVHAPNFYLYMIEGNTYYLAVQLYTDHPFSTPVAKHYNKVELTNAKSNRRGLWQPNDLFDNAAFKQALDTKPHKESFFLNLEKKYK